MALARILRDVSRSLYSIIEYNTGATITVAMRKSIYSPGQQHLIALLRQARLDAGLQQQDLAKLLGTSQSVISKIETGDRQLDILELRQVCRALGLSLEEFVRQLEQELQAGEE
jgi:DNA-binding XRE family transcriptional regulator